MSGWRTDLENAPRDGTYVFGAYETAGGRFIAFEMQWRENERNTGLFGFHGTFSDSPHSPDCWMEIPPFPKAVSA